MSEQSKLIDFVIEKEGDGNARLYIRHAANSANTISVGGLAFDKGKNGVCLGVRASLIGSEIEDLKAYFIQFFDTVKVTPQETYYEMIDRRVREGVEEKMNKMSLFERLFKRLS